MKYEWKKTIFKPEDFEGAGQYIVREHINKLNSPHFYDTGYLSTVTQKVCWSNNLRVFNDEDTSRYFLTDITDGLTYFGYYITKDEKGDKIPMEKWQFIKFSGKDNYEAKSKLCEFLNNNPNNKTYRFLTNEELIRIAAYQKWKKK